MMNSEKITFACDAMLGGLARWLRAAGYDAYWGEFINDWDLIKLSQREKRNLLSCDTGIFRVGIVRDGEVPGLLLPPGLSKEKQLAFVLGNYHLPLLVPRCMSCGGSLVPHAKEAFKEKIPRRSFDWIDKVFRCERCGHLFWEGTHWHRIARIRNRIFQESTLHHSPS